MYVTYACSEPHLCSCVSAEETAEYSGWSGQAVVSPACMLQAVLFVRDLDRGILGRGSHGLQQYEMLRRGTDALVNGILRVRRLLKQKRTADGDGEHPPDCSRF